MYCVYCGWENPAGAAFCSNCGKSTGGGEAVRPAAAAGGTYAGFGLRMSAWAVDGLLTGVLGFFCMMLTSVVLRPVILGMLGPGFPFGGNPREAWNQVDPGAKAAVIMLFVIALAAPQWLYYALQESSAGMATVGKKLVGAKVTDLGGRRITFGKATLRFLVKYVALVLPLVNLVNAAMVLSSQRRQAIHDLAAGTVVRKAD